MNVGPTFEDPSDSKTDKRKPPKRISWISKNPRVDPSDKERKEDYVKTVIWNVPPKAVVGKIVLNKDGTYTYFGEFVTPSAPNGTATPTAEDKKALEKLLQDEKADADAYHEKLKKTNKYYQTALARPGASWSGDFALHLTIDQRVAGRIATLSVRGEAQVVGASAPSSVMWELSDGREFHGAVARFAFERPGTYGVVVRAANRFGMYGTQRALVRVSSPRWSRR